MSAPPDYIVTVISCQSANISVEQTIKQRDLIQLIPELSDSHARDLHIIDSYTKISCLVVRPNIIILKVDFIKAIITADNLYLIFTDHRVASSERQQQLKDNLIYQISHSGHCLNENRIEEGNNGEGQPEGESFEFKALEAILLHISNDYESQLSQLIPNVNEVLQQSSTGGIQRYKRFLQIQIELTNLEFNVAEILLLISNLIETDEDMAEMYLTYRKKYHKDRATKDHEELEELLETYQFRIQQIKNDLDRSSKEMEATREIISIHLANRRNEIALANIYISFLNLSISVGMLIASLFGMNLLNHWETSISAFSHVTAWTIVSTVILFLISHVFYYRLKFQTWRFLAKTS